MQIVETTTEAVVKDLHELKVRKAEIEVIPPPEPEPPVEEIIV